jgi:hypothetical protein
MKQQTGMCTKTEVARKTGSLEPQALQVPAMLSPTRAWKLLCARTGGSIARVTFYRWVRNGKVFSIRLGERIFVPEAALEEVIRQCLSGERF